MWHYVSAQISYHHVDGRKSSEGSPLIAVLLLPLCPSWMDQVAEVLCLSGLCSRVRLYQFQFLSYSYILPKPPMFERFLRTRSNTFAVESGSPVYFTTSLCLPEQERFDDGACEDRRSLPFAIR